MLNTALAGVVVLVALLLPANLVRAQASTPESAKPAVEKVESVAGEHAGTHAAGEHGEEAKPELLPDLTKSETWYSALWVVIIFVVLLAVLYPTAWKNVLAGLKAREERIRKDIADAEAASAKAHATLKEYQNQLTQAEGRIREMLSKAQGDAEQIAANIRARGQQEAEEVKERATREIEASKVSAINEIYAQAAELSTSIAEKILRRSLNPQDQKDLVAGSLEQFQGINKN